MQNIEIHAWALLALRLMWRRCEMAVAADCERMARELRDG
jgi:hypothetical protein